MPPARQPLSPLMFWKVLPPKLCSTRLLQIGSTTETDRDARNRERSHYSRSDPLLNWRSRGPSKVVAFPEKRNPHMKVRNPQHLPCPCADFTKVFHKCQRWCVHVICPNLQWHPQENLPESYSPLWLYGKRFLPDRKPFTKLQLTSVYCDHMRSDLQWDLSKVICSKILAKWFAVRS